MTIAVIIVTSGMLTYFHYSHHFYYCSYYSLFLKVNIARVNHIKIWQAEYTKNQQVRETNREKDQTVRRTEGETDN